MKITAFILVSVCMIYFSKADLVKTEDLDYGIKEDFQKMCQAIKSKAEELLKKADKVVKDAEAKCKEELDKLKIQMKEVAANGLEVTKEKVKELEAKIKEGVSDAKAKAAFYQEEAVKLLKKLIDSSLDIIKNEKIKKIVEKAIHSVEWVIDHIPDSVKNWAVRAIIMKGISTIIGSMAVYRRDFIEEFQSDDLSTFEGELAMTEDLEYGIKEDFQKIGQAIKSKAEELLKKAKQVVKDAEAKCKEELDKLHRKIKVMAALGVVVGGPAVKEMEAEIKEGVSNAKEVAKNLQKDAGKQLEKLIDSSVDKIKNEKIKKIVQKVVDSVEWVIDHIPDSVKNWMVRAVIMKGISTIIGMAMYRRDVIEDFQLDDLSTFEGELAMTETEDLEYGMKEDFQKMCQAIKSKVEELLQKAEQVMKDAKAKCKEELAKLKIQMKEAAANGMVVTKEKMKELEAKIKEGIEIAKIVAKNLQKDAGKQLEILIESSVDKIKNENIKKIVQKVIDSIEWVINHIPDSMKSWFVRTIIMKGIASITGLPMYLQEETESLSALETQMTMTEDLEYGMKEDFQKMCQAIKSKVEKLLQKAEQVMKDAKAKCKEELAKLHIQMKEAAANGIVVTKEKMKELEAKIKEGVEIAKIVARNLQKNAAKQLELMLDSSVDKIKNEKIKKIVQKVIGSIEWVIDHIPDGMKNWVVRTIIMKGLQSITGGIISVYLQEETGHPISISNIKRTLSDYEEKVKSHLEKIKMKSEQAVLHLAEKVNAYGIEYLDKVEKLLQEFVATIRSKIEVSSAVSNKRYSDIIESAYIPDNMVKSIEMLKTLSQMSVKRFMREADYMVYRASRMFNQMLFDMRHSIRSQTITDTTLGSYENEIKMVLGASIKELEKQELLAEGEVSRFENTVNEITM